MTQKARQRSQKLTPSNHDVENSTPDHFATIRNIGLRRETGCERASAT
jgi:hypothetical protein